MEDYKAATHSMTNEILNIMSRSFDDPKWFVKFFLDNKLSLENCYVCTVDNKVVSLLHVIPLKVRLNKNDFNGAYIYGVCTSPEYRNNGYMTKLIKYTHKVCLESGYECAFLSPASEKLENFYKKLGYSNFFRIKQIELTKDEFIKLCKGCCLSAQINQSSIDYNLLNKFRIGIYENDNFVSYSSEDLSFADKLYNFNFGGLVSISEGYGFCMPLNSNKLKIMDFTSAKGKEIQLLKKIYETFPSYDNFIIETSTVNKFFKNYGNDHFNGMICPLSERCELAVESIRNNNGSSYLGISFE